MQWLGTDRIVGIRLNVANLHRRVHNKTCWHRQCPGIITVVCGKIDFKGIVNPLQLFRQGEFYSQACRNGVVRIADDREGEFLLLCDSVVVLFQLWRNGD